MCTVCTWAENRQACLSSRNMDWFEAMPTSLWVIPRGQEHTAGLEGTNPLQWTSKYGSVVAVCYGIGTADGLNEKGLSASVLWLAESQFGERDVRVPGLAVSLWAQYYLDNFATVDEAVAAFEKMPYQITPADVAGRPATVHLHLSDATGNVAVMEVLDGQLSIHHGREFKVLTNSPTFAEQLKNLKQYAGFGGERRLPGTTDAADRFVRAAFYMNALPEPDSTRMAIAELLSVLRNVAQPFGVADPERPNVSPTRWRTVRDHSHLVYYYESTTSPYLVWLNFANLDLSEGASPMVIPDQELHSLMGEQSVSLQPKELFHFRL